ncbi:hypothetical protein HN51_050232, partial [Arachis hypogaea]
DPHQPSSPPAAATLVFTVSVLVVKPASVIVVIGSDRGCRRCPRPRSSSPLCHANCYSILFKRILLLRESLPRDSP